MARATHLNQSQKGCKRRKSEFCGVVLCSLPFSVLSETAKARGATFGPGPRELSGVAVPAASHLSLFEARLLVALLCRDPFSSLARGAVRFMH